MNKKELVEQIAVKTGKTKKDVEAIVNETLAVIEETLANGDKVQLIGFGTFETRKRKPRQGVNPRRPKEKVAIPGCTMPAFKPGKTLKEACNK